MLKDLQKLIGQKGSMMVEALAMLGLISMVTPVLYKKAAERTSELQDINSATQLRTLVKAMDDYIKDNYVTLSAGAQKQTVTAAQLKPYLPYGFNASATSKVFKPFKMAVRKEVAGGYTSLTGIVVAEPSTDLPRLRSTKIAAMVGANGGWAENGADAVGVQGGWTAKLADYGLTAGAGSLAATSVHSIASSSVGGGADDVLYRANMGNKDFNTMKVSLYMGGNAIREIDKLISRSAGSTVTIGSGNDGTGTAHLTVKGNTNMVNLVASGTGSIAQAFTASSTSNLKGAVTAGSTITAAGLVTANNGLTVNTAKLTANAGATVANGLTVSSGGANITGGATVKGGVTVADTGLTVTAGGAKIAGGASVTGGLTADTGTITGNLGVGETLTTKNLTVTQNLTVAGNLTVTGTGYFGKMLTANAGLTVTSGGAKITAGGLNVAKDGASVTGGLTVTSGGATITAGGLKVSKDGATIAGGATVTGGLTADTANISANDFIVNANDISIKPNAGAGALTINSSSLDSSTTGTFVKGANNDFSVGKDATQTNSTFYVDNDAAATAGTNNSIYVRKGVMEIAANKSTDGKNPTGYIKLDRIVDNKGFDDPKISYGIGTAYDEYMVNPAYTSVMHDIKLTTRGGARLSDILPEFINKGIYVIDNTYKESAVGDWGTMTLAKAQSLSKSTAATDVCDSDGAMCIASPWLGFVPTPQCPAGYAKVITINPIRWKMAEAYSVTAATLNSANIASGLIFERPTYPKRLQLTVASGSGSHTHEPEVDVMPLTFQVNTWLNTTIKGCKGDSCASGDFKGWHAIMGFLYRSNDYQEYLTKIGKWGSVGANKIIWNLFPVYKEELTAISEVYCYFERRKEFNAWNKALVDTTYDQLVSFRGDNKKDDTNGYVTRLNDSKLKYTDPW